LHAVALSLVAATFWCIGNLQSLQVFDLANPFWSNCGWWVLWAQLMLGISLYLNVMIFRLYRLVFLIVLSIEPKGFKFWGPVIVFYIPIVILALALLIFPGQFMTVTPILNNGSLECSFPNMGYLGLTYLTVLVQMIYCFVIFMTLIIE
jgi:hypothetical protein